MDLIGLIIMAVGLAMDAFAVSVMKGFAAGRTGLRAPLTAGLYFGAFQAAMPALGSLSGLSFAGRVDAVDHWIAFLLLSVIGGRMILDARRDMARGGTAVPDADAASFSPAVMLPLAVATSVDALAAGLSLSFLGVNIVLAAGVIGVTAFLFSFLGVLLGRSFGSRFGGRAEAAGGAALVFMGAKILAGHLWG